MVVISAKGEKFDYGQSSYELHVSWQTAVAFTEMVAPGRLSMRTRASRWITAIAECADVWFLLSNCG